MRGGGKSLPEPVDNAITKEGGVVEESTAVQDNKGTVGDVGSLNSFDVDV